MFKLLMVRKRQINVQHSATLFCFFLFGFFVHLKSQAMHMKKGNIYYKM